MDIENSQKGLFKFVKHPMLRKALEVLFSSIPGAVVLFVFLLGTGVLNIYSNLSETNDVFAASYIPIICLLPVVVGIVGPLILEKVRDETRLSMRGSILVSFLSALLGSGISSLVLVITGIASPEFKPFGGAILDNLGQLPGLGAAFLVLVVACTILSIIGGAIIVVVLGRAEK
ncbi:hypothetical protein COU37_05345 [Candidatus Micrarchaeota archaeon CG10_big_fil_rev_8_21_14_0_10_45_29]|nr:MAG: hypothetical protein COU37_05345 [Candidatus Micrarchaeota archaeon CG10_big_fil_rev_8_21_14_0_10_45_29]